MVWNWNKVAGYASAADRMVHVDFSFPPADTRVVMGRGRYEAGEVWRLVGSELEEDWNYWIVQFRVAPLANWIVGWIVPWWGRYADL